MQRGKDSVQYSRIDGLDGLEVMSARWLEHSFAPHMHDFHAISLNYGGRGGFDCKHGHHDAAPGTCNLIAAGELHTGQAASENGWVYRNLYIERPLMNALLESLDSRVGGEFTFKSPLANDPVLAGRLARVFSRLAESSSLLENESLLMSVVARLATDHLVPGGYLLRDAGREHAAVRRAKDWLEAYSEQNVSLRVLAEVAGLSPYYLVRVFHKQIGIPPHKYQTIVRVHRARKLLASGGALAEVAYCTGFCDQSHLNRSFKRMLGITPGDYATSGPHC